MLPGLALLLAQEQVALPDSAELKLRRAPEAVLVESSALGALEEELIALHQRLRPVLVQVRIPLAADPERNASAQEVLVSGVVLDEDDLVVAPGPIPRTGASIVVVRFDGREFAAATLAEDALCGLSLLRAEGLNVRPPVLGECDLLPVGSVTVSLGNAYGLEGSMTLGFVSGRDRTLGQVRGLLQVTNPVNPGDGGGLLADRHGCLAGILLTSLAEAARRQRGEDDAAAGPAFWRCQDVSFAVPVERVLEAFAPHMSRQPRARPWLGVVVGEEYDPVRAAEAGGGCAVALLVQEVTEGSPAQRAGLRMGDRIVRVGASPVRSLGCLRRQLATSSGELDLVVLRGGDTLVLKVRMSERKDDAALAPAGAAPPGR